MTTGQDGESVPLFFTDTAGDDAVRLDADVLSDAESESGANVRFQLSVRINSVNVQAENFLIAKCIECVLNLIVCFPFNLLLLYPCWLVCCGCKISLSFDVRT